MNLLVTAVGPGLAGEPMTTDEETVAAAALAAFNLTENGYLVEQFTRPETTGYALLGGPLSGNLTREHILDNVTLFGLTGTGVSGARSYRESFQARLAGGGRVAPPVTVSVAFSAFPSEIFKTPGGWIQHDYPTLGCHNKPDRGLALHQWFELAQ
jgi:hypothetical protein